MPAHTEAPPRAASAVKSFDVERVRADFPCLHQQVNGQPLVYLDSAATAQKPRAVIDAISRHYSEDCANVHRGVHTLSQRATDAYEGAREKVRAFLNAESVKEILFTRGATEGLNLIAQSYARTFLKAGDEILITEMEHHANIVPWQIVRDQVGLTLRAAPMNDRGELIMEEFEKLAISGRVKLIAFPHTSNALGTVNPINEILELARRVGAVSVVDGAQAVPHTAVDVRALGCDFFTFSGHKLFGPTGSGVVYGRRELLEKMPPWQGGGDMIDRVTFEKTTWNDLPYKFEAGTPDIAAVIGLGAAIDYVNSIGYDAIAAHENDLLQYGNKILGDIVGLRMYGTADHKAAVFSFNIDGLHAHDVAAIIDMEGVAVRVGHHCAQTVMQHFGIPATSRASLSFYNTRAEIDRLADAIRKAIRMLS